MLIAAIGLDFYARVIQLLEQIVGWGGVGSGGGGTSLTESQVTNAIDASSVVIDLSQIALKLDDVVDNTGNTASLFKPSHLEGSTLLGTLGQNVADIEQLLINQDWHPYVINSTSAEYSTPGVNAYPTFTVPIGQEWQFQAIQFVYSAHATSTADRTPLIGFTVGGSFVLQAPARSVQTTGTLYYEAGMLPANDTPADNKFVCIPCPPLILAAGSQIVLVCEDKQLGDTFTAPSGIVLRRSV